MPIIMLNVNRLDDSIFSAIEFNILLDGVEVVYKNNLSQAPYFIDYDGNPPSSFVISQIDPNDPSLTGIGSLETTVDGDIFTVTLNKPGTPDDSVTIHADCSYNSL